MDFKITDHRIFAENESGKLIAEILFPEDGPNTVCFTHTFVDDSLRGQGVAGQLIETAAQTLTAQGKKAHATCSYAVRWLEDHPELKA